MGGAVVGGRRAARGRAARGYEARALCGDGRTPPGHVVPPWGGSWEGHYNTFQLRTCLFVIRSENHSCFSPLRTHCDREDMHSICCVLVGAAKGQGRCPGTGGCQVYVGNLPWETNWMNLKVGT